MPTNYTGNPASATAVRTNPTITEPSDGEPRNAASVDTAMQALADEIAALKQKVAYLASSGAGNTAVPADAFNLTSYEQHTITVIDGKCWDLIENGVKILGSSIFESGTQLRDYYLVPARFPVGSRLANNAGNSHAIRIKASNSDVASKTIEVFVQRYDFSMNLDTAETSGFVVAAGASNVIYTYDLSGPVSLTGDGLYFIRLRIPATTTGGQAVVHALEITYECQGLHPGAV